MINSNKLQSYKSKLIQKIETNLNTRPVENGPELRFLHDQKEFTQKELAQFKLKDSYLFKEHRWLSITICAFISSIFLGLLIYDSLNNQLESPLFYLCMIALFAIPGLFALLLPRNKVKIDKKGINYFRGDKITRHLPWNECLFAYYDSIVRKHKGLDWTMLKFLDKKNREIGISLVNFSGISQRELGKIVYCFMKQAHQAS